MFALPRFGFYLGFKGSTGRHGSEIEFQIAGMKKSIHSETGRKVKSFLGDGQDTFSGWTVKKALINTLKARIWKSGFKVKEQRKNLCWLNHFFKVTISGRRWIWKLRISSWNPDGKVTLKKVTEERSVFPLLLRAAIHSDSVCRCCGGWASRTRKKARESIQCNESTM